MRKILTGVFATLVFGFHSFAADFPDVPSGDGVIVITFNDGDTLSDTQIAEMSDATTAIVFDGSGTITASKTLAGVSKPVHVPSGVTFCSTFGGPTALATGTFYVHSGASIYADNSLGNYYKDYSTMKPTGSIALEGGEGATGQGAQYLMSVYDSTTGDAANNARMPFAKSLTLYGDSTAKIVLPNTPKGTMIVCSSDHTFNLNGHFLTWRANPNSAQLCIDAPKINDPDGGGFIADGMGIRVRANSGTTLSGNGEFRFINGGSLRFEESQKTKQPIGWFINWDEKNGYIYSNNYREDQYPEDGYPNSKYCLLNGTFTLLSDLMLTNGVNVNAEYNIRRYKPLALGGKVTGPHGIFATDEISNRGTARWWALSLLNPENDFTGGVTMNKGYLQLFANGALPADGDKLLVKDTVVELLPTTINDWSLPELDITANSDGTGVVQTTGMPISGSWKNGITKKGDGTLQYKTAVGGDVLDVTKGTMEISVNAADSAGLISGAAYFAEYAANGATTEKDRASIYIGTEPPLNGKSYSKGTFHVTNEANYAAAIAAGTFDYATLANNAACGIALRQSYDFETGLIHWRDDYIKLSDTSLSSPMPTVTNSIATGPENAFLSGTTYSSAIRYTVYSYTGYLWNDAPTNETWTIASSVNQYYKLQIGDKIVNKTTVWQESSPSQLPTHAYAQGRLYTFELKPGPNKFTMLTINNFVGTVTDKSRGMWTSIATNGFEKWEYDRLGLAYRRGDYSSVTANGDDYTPLRNTDDKTIFTIIPGARMPEFGEIKIADGATLKCNLPDGIAYRVNDISGAGDVDGDLEINGVLKLAAADVASGKVLTVDGKVVFGDDTTIKVNGTLPNNADGAWTVLSATSLEGATPTVVDAAGNLWKAQIVGNSLKLISEASGGGDVLDATNGKIRLSEMSYAPVAGLNKGLMWFSDYALKHDSSTSYKNQLLLIDDPQNLDIQQSVAYSKGYFHVTNAMEIGKYVYKPTDEIADPTNANKSIGYIVKQGYNWDNSLQYSTYYSGRSAITNYPASDCPDAAFVTEDGHTRKTKRYTVFTYKGYIWNPDNEPKTWTLGVSWNHYYTIYLGDTQIAKVERKTAFTSGSPEGMIHKLTLQPGPNPIEFRSWNYFVSENCFPKAWTGFTNWSTDLAIAYAKSDTDSKDGNDFTPLRDPGDGSLFTTEVDGVSPHYNKLLLGGNGSEIDLNLSRDASAYEVADIEGEGTIKGGNLRLTGKFSVTTNASGAIAKLTVEKGIAFAEGATVGLADGLNLTVGGEYVLAEAASITGLPKIAPELEGMWEVVVVDNEDTQQLKLVSSISKGGSALAVAGEMKYKTYDYAGMAGVWEGIDGPYKTFNDAALVADFDNSVVFTNTVKQSLRLFYMTCDEYTDSATGFRKSGLPYPYVTYDGYLWNDTGSEQLWSIANTCNSKVKVIINGVTYNTDFKRKASGSPVDDNGGKVWKDVPIHPGANKFTVCFWPNYSNPPYMLNVATNLFSEDWGDTSGLMFDTQNRGSYNRSDYVKFEDAGDGKLLTREAAAAPVFGEVDFETGSSLDLNDPTGEYAGRAVMHTFDTVKGAGEFKNGNVTITDSIEFKQAEVEAGETLTLTGGLTLGDGVTIYVTPANGPAALANGEYTLVEAEGGITGTAALDPSLDGKWTLEQDGSKIILKRATKGMLLLIR